MPLLLKHKDPMRTFVRAGGLLMRCCLFALRYWNRSESGVNRVIMRGRKPGPMLSKANEMRYLVITALQNFEPYFSLN
jgi:hypothetical protein